jgi:hypothetical protein
MFMTQSALADQKQGAAQSCLRFLTFDNAFQPSWLHLTKVDTLVIMSLNDYIDLRCLSTGALGPHYAEAPQLSDRIHPSQPKMPKLRRLNTHCKTTHQQYENTVG